MFALSLALGVGLNIMANQVATAENETIRRSTGGTLQDVARHLGVHPMTVSRALSGNGRISETTRQNVRRAAEELGYRPNLAARSLRQGHNPKMVVLFSTYLDSGMHTIKLEGIQNILGAAGYETPIHSCGFHNRTGSLQAEMMAGLCAQRPAAIVCNTHLLKEPAIAALRGWIEDGGVAVLYDHDHDLPCDHVVFDREDAGFQTARHLIDLGHTRIGYAHHSPVDGPDERMLGVRRALKQNGLDLQGEWTFRADESVDCEAGGRTLADQFLALPPAERPTALCIVNDLAALAFVARLNENGVRVPQDLSIVAHDDRPFATYAAVPLTVISHPAQEIARQVAELVLSRLNNREAPPRRVVVCGELRVRSSSKSL